MKVLVTGGAGFIGSHVTARLTASQHEVAVIDDLNEFYSPEYKRANLAAGFGSNEPHFVHADIRDIAAVNGLFASFRPDAVIHLAARAGVRPSLADPLLYEQVNVGGTMVLLEAARAHKTPKFVFASSSSIYGATNQVPFSEADSNNLPISPYAATKLAGEKICYTHSHLFGIDVVCLRFFTVYGPRQRPDLAIRKFMERIDEGKPIPFFGDGTAGRDYTYVDDTVSGIVSALHHETRYDIFNLGNSAPVTLTEMVATIEDALGKKARIDRQPDQPGDVPITFADISKARRVLGYDPQTPFAEGIRRMAVWFREQAVTA